jgi:hypothetical protein
MLNLEILEILVKKSKRSEKTVRNRLSTLHQKYSGLTMNQVAQIFALENGFSVRSKLSRDERATFPNLEIQKPITIVKKSKTSGEKVILKQFIKYQTTDTFIEGHIDETNRSYTYGCYTACFILCRKIIENMLTDVIRKKYPQNSLQNLEMFYDTSRNRTRDFSEIISTLRRHSNDFGPDRTLLERILTRAEQLKDEANNKTHSWFHIVKTPKELQEMHVQDILDMIVKLEKNL